MVTSPAPCRRGSQQKRIDDKVQMGPGLSSPAVALFVGWGVRSTHAPENGYVVGLRLPDAEALAIAVSTKHPIFNRSQNPAWRRRRRHRHQRGLSADHRLRVGTGNERPFARHRSFRDGARERRIDPGASTPKPRQACVGRSTHRGQLGNGSVVPFPPDAGPVLGGYEPTVLRTTIKPGAAPVWVRVRIEFDTRQGADSLCSKLEAAGELCLVQRNSER
jgi:hypothetical protein